MIKKMSVIMCGVAMCLYLILPPTWHVPDGWHFPYPPPPGWIVETKNV